MALIAAEQTLRDSLETVAKELNYSDPEIKISVVSTEGANYTSFLFESTVSSKGKDDLQLFSKVAAVGEKMRAQAPMKVFDSERIFYTQLLKEYRLLEKKNGVPEEHSFKAPKIYKVNPTLYKETFVMENLAAKGYTLHDRFKTVDWDYAAASFTELAKMHALSMAFKREKPEEFNKIVEELTFNWSTVETGDLKGLMEEGMKKTLEVTREDTRGKLMAFLGQAMAQGGMESFMKFYLPGENPVIRHGDYRPSNLMHKPKEDGSGMDIVVVDFQTLVASTPIVDLLYFIFLGTDKAFRDQYFDKLVDHYYKELSAALARLGLDPEETYPRHQFDSEFKESLPYGLMVAMTTLPLVTVDAADAPTVTGEHDMSSFTTMKLSAVFIDRVNGVFDTFVDMGLL